MSENEILALKLEALAELLNIATSSETYTDKEREDEGHKLYYKTEHLKVDNYPMYGGYKIVLLGVNGSSGQYEPFGSQRRKYSDFIDFLNTLILGVSIGNGNFKI